MPLPAALPGCPTPILSLCPLSPWKGQLSGCPHQILPLCFSLLPPTDFPIATPSDVVQSFLPPSIDPQARSFPLVCFIGSQVVPQRASTVVLPHLPFTGYSSTPYSEILRNWVNLYTTSSYFHGVYPWWKTLFLSVLNQCPHTDNSHILPIHATISNWCINHVPGIL